MLYAFTTIKEQIFNRKDVSSFNIGNSLLMSLIFQCCVGNGIPDTIEGSKG